MTTTLTRFMEPEVQFDKDAAVLAKAGGIMEWLVAKERDASEALDANLRSHGAVVRRRWKSQWAPTRILVDGKWLDAKVRMHMADADVERGPLAPGGEGE